MTAQLTILDLTSTDFPPADFALNEPDGLLAIGGDLSLSRLISAYKNGIFPWFNQGEPIMWWSPSSRAVLKIGEINISRSLRKLARQNKYSVSVNTNFNQVIHNCIKQRENQEGTWITNEMKSAYIALHKAGFAHSIEVYNCHKELVGGLYGIMVNHVFCGESMFHFENNCSKLAFWALHNHLKNNGVTLIDCQLENPHLMSLGVTTISRNEFLAKLKKSKQREIDVSMWQSQQLMEIYD
ncbi:leucyl/phenylalanyl-tRNA--protein transferase [Pseudoalteromonas sp. SSM20]|uniref:leucyl/phenylalanyl-tRNA--protein transferase n=1 Tax=Pseudoalteromonas sp. SSM20 TaxID=3139394 RepID=UPI003BAA10CE